MVVNAIGGSDGVLHLHGSGGDGNGRSGGGGGGPLPRQYTSEAILAKEMGPINVRRHIL